MSSVLVLTFSSAAPVATGVWPLEVAAGAVTTYALDGAVGIPGAAAPVDTGWRPGPGESLRIDASAVEATFGEFAVDAWIGAAALVEPVVLLSGAGAPLELTLVAAATAGRIQAIASIRTSGAPVVLLSDEIAITAAPVRLGVWVSGTDAALAVQGFVQRRLRFARTIPDARGEIVVAGPAADSTSALDLIALTVADELDAAQDAELGRAAADGIGEIDSLIASGAATGLGAPTETEQRLGRLRWRVFAHGTVYWTAMTGAHAVFSRSLRPYTAGGGPTGRLGLPTSPEMGLDQLLTWLRVPSRYTGNSLRGVDVFTRVGDLKLDDLVVEHAQPTKPGPTPDPRTGWDAVVAVDSRLAEVRVASEPALDADWVAGLLGHTSAVSWRGGAEPAERGGAEPVEGGVLRRRGEGVVWLRRENVEGMRRFGRQTPQVRQGRDFAALRDALADVLSAREPETAARAALWGEAAVLHRAADVSVSEAALRRVVQVPETAAGLSLTVPAASTLDAVAAATVRDALGAAPDETVTIAADAVRHFAAGIGEALERGDVTAAQVTAIAPRLVLRTPGAAEIIGAPGAQELELGAVADNGAIAGLLDQSMRTGIELHVEVEGAVWALVGPRAQLFQHGVLIATAQGVYEIGEHILTHWVLLGGTRGLLGAPRGSEAPVTGGTQAWADGGRWAPFANGRVYWSAATGAHEIHGAILARYLQRSSNDVALFVPPIGELLGLPITDEQPVAGISGARLSAFTRGRIYWSARTGAWEVYAEILGQLTASGGTEAWGLPTGPQTVRAGAGQRLITQPFERGTIAILVRDGVVRVLDSLQVVIARVTTGNIDDDTLFIRDRDAELIVVAQVWADDVKVLDRTSPKGGRVAEPGWVTPAIDPKRLRSLRVRIEAWDHDNIGPNDLLAVVDVTYGYDDGFFGFALGDAWGIHRASAKQGDAIDPVSFDYTIGREVALSLDRFRQDFFWQRTNTGRPELPWSMYRGTFDDIDANSRGSADTFERALYDDRYRGVAAGGNCGGFSITGVEAFLRRDLTQPLAEADLQIDPGNVCWQRINRGQGSQMASSVLSWRADGTDDDDFCDPRRVFTRVSDSIRTSGTPAILTFWFKDGDDKGGHAVLVWRCEIQGSTRVMYLADSNFPFSVRPTFTDSRIEIAADGSYRVFPTSNYAQWAGGAWTSGSLGDEYMIEIPYGLFSDPLRSPAFDLGSGFLGLLGGVFSAAGANVDQVSSGDRRLYDDQRSGIVGTLRERGSIVESVVASGLAAWAEPAAEQPAFTESLRQATAMDAGRLAAIADVLAPGLAGTQLDARLVEAMRIVPGAAEASSSWGVIARPGIAFDISGGATRWLSPRGWTGVADVTPADDSGALVVFRGEVPDDVRTDLRGRGETYRLTMMGRAGVVTVSAPLARGAVDAVNALSLSSVRTGVAVTGAADGRIATVSVEAPARQGTAVGWSVPLGLGAEAASVRWLAGRPGLEVRHAAAVPETTIEWGDAGSARSYRAPNAAAGERLRVLPDDPASPFGAIRLQRRSAVGDLLATEVIEPAG